MITQNERDMFIIVIRYKLIFKSLYLHSFELFWYLTISGSVLETLRAFDLDDLQLTFAIQGEIAKDLLLLNSTGPMSAKIQLKSPLNREVCTISGFLKNSHIFYYTLSEKRRCKFQLLHFFLLNFFTSTYRSVISTENCVFVSESGCHHCDIWSAGFCERSGKFIFSTHDSTKKIKWFKIVN